MRRSASAAVYDELPKAALRVAARTKHKKPSPYRDRPDLWALECIDWREGDGPAPYQLDVLSKIMEHKRIAVRAPHGAGKTALESWVLLWFATTRDGDDWKIPTTASAWRQLTHYLWPEVRKWARRLKWDKLGRGPFSTSNELLMLNLKLRTGEAFALASNDPSSIEGAHADHLLYLFDEAKTISGDTFDAAEGAFSGGSTETLAVVVSTPGDPSGRFYDIHRRAPGYEDWYTRHVTLDEMIAAGRQSPAWVEQRRRQWGAGSAVYQNRVLGEFATNSEDGVIPLAWVEMANERWHEWQEREKEISKPDYEGEDVPLRFVGVGVDVGLTHDKTVFARLYGDRATGPNAIAPLERYGKSDTMETAGRVKGIVDAHGGYSVIDVTGVGSGVLHRLQEQKSKTYPFVASGKSDKHDITGELGFANRRAEAWWNAREMLAPENGHDVALPPDDTLTGDLTAPKYRVMSGGKILVESKDDLKKPDRLGRSTDDGDAVVMVLADPTGGKALPFSWMDDE